MYTSAGFAALVGPPLAGFLIDRTGSYQWAIAASLAMGMAAFGVLVPLQGHSVLTATVAELDWRLRRRLQRRDNRNDKNSSQRGSVEPASSTD